MRGQFKKTHIILGKFKIDLHQQYLKQLGSTADFFRNKTMCQNMKFASNFKVEPLLSNHVERVRYIWMTDGL